MKQHTILAASIAAGCLLSAPLATAEDAAISTDTQKFSYGIGLQIGQSLSRQNVSVDQDAMFLAIKDALEGKEPRVSLEELQKVMAAEEQKIQQQQNAAGDKNLEVGKAFLEENKKRDGITTTNSGLQYRIITEGSGAKPQVTDTVTVHYRGTLIDGEEFDSSYKRGEPATFPLNGVIKGWQEALPLIKEGGKWEIFVPSELAYGPKGAGASIGPNETLIFEIELLNIGQ